MINTIKSYLAPALGLWPIAVFGTRVPNVPLGQAASASPALADTSLHFPSPPPAFPMLRPKSPYVLSYPTSVSLRNPVETQAPLFPRATSIPMCPLLSACFDKGLSQPSRGWLPP